LMLHPQSKPTPDSLRVSKHSKRCTNYLPLIVVSLIAKPFLLSTLKI
jgi:hypothetical protein